MNIDTSRNYRATPVGSGMRTSANGNDCIWVRFTVPELPEIDDVFWGAYFSDGALTRSVEGLKACGRSGDPNEPESIREDVDVKLEYSEFNGNTELRVAFVNPIRSAGAVDNDIASRIAAKMKVHGITPAEPVDDIAF